MQQSEGQRVLARDVARCVGIPLPYLPKVLHSLVRSGLVVSTRGYQGAVALIRPANRTRVMEVAIAVEGASCLPDCLLGEAVCSDEGNCPPHRFRTKTRGRIEAELSQVTLEDVAKFMLRQGRGINRCGDAEACRPTTKSRARSAAGRACCR